MELKNVLKLIASGILAPLLFQLFNQYIPGFPLSLELLTELLVWIVLAVFSSFKARGYIKSYAQKKKMAG